MKACKPVSTRQGTKKIHSEVCYSVLCGLVTCSFVEKKTMIVSDLTENARSNVHNIHFVDSQIKELSNKLAVAETARMAYSSALKNELTLQQSEG